MYTLKEGWMAMFGEMPTDDWDGKIYCDETDGARSFLTNRIQGFMAAYTFTLVTHGQLVIAYNDKELMLQADDLFFYSPGMSVTVLSASTEYQGLCLMADEHATIELTTVHDLVYIAYAPIVQLCEPKLTLPHTESLRLAEKMREIIGYLHTEHLYKTEVLRLLYAVFLLDVQNAQQHAITRRQTSQRVEEIFIGFIRLLPQHFAEHRDIGFYASALNISSVYLSRVVRQITGRTVMDYINQMIVMEAMFLLRTSPMNIAQIADRLHFADTPSFSKFFSRLKGISPREYRVGN